MRSKGCRISVEVTPPVIPAIKCSYFTSFRTLVVAGPEGPVIVFIDVISLAFSFDVTFFQEVEALILEAK